MRRKGVNGTEILVLEPNKIPEKPTIAYPLLSIAAISWAGNFVVARAMYIDIPPVGFAFWRWSLATLILLPFTFSKIRQNWVCIRFNFIRIALTAFFGIVLFNTLVYGALNTTTAINGALILSLIPAIIPIVSMFILDERCALRQCLGILVSTIGVIILISHGSINTIILLEFVLGDILMFLATITWSIYSVLVKQLPEVLGPEINLTVLMLAGSVMLMPIYVVETIWFRGVIFDMHTVWSLAYVALFASVLAMLCFNRGVSMIGPNRAGPFQHLIPVLTVLLAVAFLNEVFEIYHLSGFGLVACGLFLASAGRR